MKDEIGWQILRRKFAVGVGRNYRFERGAPR
jgi:hypothetical protein